MIVTKEEIEQAKRSHSIVELVESRGIQLRRQGASYVGLCPFHEETKPSFTVYPRTQTWKCFGCPPQEKSQGDVIGFVCRFDHVSFAEAMAVLKGAGSASTRKLVVTPPAKRNGKAGGNGKALAAEKGNGESHPAPEAPVDETREVRRLKLLARVSGFYEAELSRDKRGIEYLKTRGIESPRALRDFRVGFASGGLSKVAGAADREDLVSAGVVTSSGREHFEGCVTIPLFDSQGAVAGMYGRRTSDGEPRHLYLPGKLHGIANREAAKEGKPVVLTEAILDALSLYEKGFQRVIPVYGTGGLTDEIILWLLRCKVREVYLAFDSDDAGEKGAAWAAEKLIERGILARTLRLPEKDLNDFFLKGHTLAEFETLIQAASPVHAKTEAASRGEERLFQTTSHGFRVQWGTRLYETKALIPSGTQLKCTLKVSKEADSRSEISTIDLFSHRSREAFARSLSELFGEDEALIREDLRRLLEKAEAWKAPGQPKDEAPEMTEAERAEAIEFLSRPDLIDRILEDFDALGYVGGQNNKLLAYLVATSRLLEEPLSLTIQSRSSAGKSALLDAVLALMPPEAYVKYTRITDQALFYRDEFSLQHKILALEESKGAGGATYSIQALQSNKMISLCSTAKDPATGKGISYERKVRGPTSVMSTTTDPVLDGELATRCLVTTVDESREMTEKIHSLQRWSMTLEGIAWRVGREAVQKRHQNAQRVLKTLKVVNQLAPRLKFPAEKLRSRRDQMKYLYLINAIALLHQHQREVKKAVLEGKEVDYIEVVDQDVHRANRVAEEVLGYSLDEIAQGSRKLWKAIDEMARLRLAELAISAKEYRFSRKDIRKWTGWSDFQIRDHIRQLTEMEILYEHQGRKGREYVYELGYDPLEPMKIDLVDP